MARLPRFGPTLTGAQRRRVNIRINTDPVVLAVADGLYAVAQAIGEEASAHAPDEPPLNEGLPKNWGVMEYALGKLVAAQGGDGGSSVSKPRDLRVGKTEAMALVGFGFPGRFNEVGTVHQPARPFLGPVAMGVVTGPEFGATLAEHFPKGETP